ncbi:alpha/beta fold hydrolase [Henriciella litoralis]|uniref:alpha/beta fold hydrolase n=1 Tax=Henriciella litoralis TaxID=568102 RepID=UPI001F27E115|nr:alpha/beta fold hydrolase [Henriciella litoralis]
MARSHFYKSDAGRQIVETAYRDILSRWPVASEQRCIQTRSGETFVLACGPEYGPALILLHGSVANLASWMGNIETYARHFCCYCVDMIGEPGFSAPVREPLDSEAHALWLDDVMDGLGLHAAVFVGLSLGGWLALDYARRRPDRVSAIAGIAPAGIGKQKNILLKALPLLFMGKKGAMKLRDMVLGPQMRQQHERPLVERFVAFNALVMDNFRGRIVKIPLLSDEELAGLKMPVLVIAGGRDVLIDSDHTRTRIETVAPQIRLDYRPEAYHFIPDTAEQICFFLEASGALDE